MRMNSRVTHEAQCYQVFWRVGAQTLTMNDVMHVEKYRVIRKIGIWIRHGLGLHFLILHTLPFQRDGWYLLAQSIHVVLRDSFYCRFAFLSRIHLSNPNRSASKLEASIVTTTGLLPLLELELTLRD